MGLTDFVGNHYKSGFMLLIVLVFFGLGMDGLLIL